MGFTGDVENITEEDKAALVRWFGESASWVMATLADEDHGESAEEIMDGLREPTYPEYGEAKRAAREAAVRIMGY